MELMQNEEFILRNTLQGTSGGVGITQIKSLLEILLK